MKLRRIIFGGAITLLVSSMEIATAQSAFWASPESQIRSGSSSDGQGRVVSLTSDTAMQYERSFGTLNEQGGQGSFTFTQTLSNVDSLMFSRAEGIDQDNTVLGYSRGNLAVSFMKGRGRSFAELGGRYAGIDPFQFHSGTGRKFNYNGYAVDFSTGTYGRFQYGQSIVQADGLLDRKAQYVQWVGGSTYARVTEFSRGNEGIGQGLDLGFTVGSNKQIGFQAMELDNDRSLQRIRLQLNGEKTRQYWVDLSSHRNALYRDNDDVSLMFTFRSMIGTSSMLSSYADGSASGDSEVAGDTGPGENKKKSRKLLWIGAGVAAGAALSSSGSGSNDSLGRFKTERDAAFDVLNGINPVSMRENAEYGGWVYVYTDGSYASSTPVKGDAKSVHLPNPNLVSVIPETGRLTASYHTHGAFDPRYDNENFSPLDLEGDRERSINGYLGTPGGQFKYFNFSTDQVTTLGRIATGG